jgi:hypothetical protein
MCKINFKMPVFPEGITDAERRSIMFETLSSLDLSHLIEKRENLAYLSWSNCFSILKQIYPLATYRVIKNPENGLPYFTDRIGIFVYTEVEIEGVTTECFLPVMDNKNKAMRLEPYTYQVWDNYKKNYVKKNVNAATSFDVNRTIWRALVKNVALATGIGLSLYTGEDVPSIGDDTNSSAPQQQMQKAVQHPIDPLSPIKNANNSMVDVNSLMNLYFDHQNEVEGNPEIKALFTQRRQQLQLLAGRK